MMAATLVVTPTRRRIVVLRPCYGGTESLLAGPLGNLGVQVSTVDLPVDGGGDHGALVAAALGDDVAAVVTEVITNPLIGLVDVPAVVGRRPRRRCGHASSTPRSRPRSSISSRSRTEPTS